MKHFYIYGTNDKDFEKLKVEISQLLDVQLAEHESGWWGVYALGKTPSINEIKLYPNFVEGEGCHEQGGYEYLLAISYQESYEEIPKIMRASFNNFELIRHDEL